jgi:hypothetical protein
MIPLYKRTPQFSWRQILAVCQIDYTLSTRHMTLLGKPDTHIVYIGVYTAWDVAKWHTTLTVRGI